MSQLRTLASTLRTVLLWFLGTAIISVWFIFHDNKFDYRPLLIGVLLPDFVDIWFGGARALHSVLVTVVVMGVIVLSTSRLKPTRARLLPLPIGMFLHLVFDAAFASTRTFWWPFSGFRFANQSLPVANRMGYNVLLELAGAALLYWAWKRFALADPRRRQQFWRKGWLVDEKGQPQTGTC